MNENIALNISALHKAYAKNIRPVQIIEQIYNRIDEVGDPNIFICLFSKEEVIRTVEALGEYNPDLPLWGVPYVIKDNIDFAGKPTTAGCPEYAYIADKSAFVVKCLQEAGAVLLGKTNLDQFATGLVGVRTPYGAPLNALDTELVPGGSSSGSAVCVAHGIASFSLGTDTAGSGRVPAALNNIVGLKPTLGSISSTGVVPACRTLDTVSIFALTASDAYTVFSVAAKFDKTDSFAKSISTPSLVTPPKSLNIGIPSSKSIRFEDDKLQQQSFTETIKRFEENGAHILEVDFQPFYEIASMLYFGPWVAERFVAIEDLMDKDPDAVFHVTRKIIETANNFSAVDTFKGLYKLKQLIGELRPIINNCDLLCVPSIPTFVKLSDLELDPFGPNNLLGTYTNFVNLMDLCAISVPTATRVDGRPGSITLIAKAENDPEIAALACSVEAWGHRTLGATNWPVEQTNLQDATSDKFICIAVCGAHLTGLPLNSSLTNLGARFLRSDRTAKEYKFYALPNSDVAKPGLIRSSTKDGTSVSVELWEIPANNFGELIRTVPAPLCIGTIKLLDGTDVKGFLCEGFAADISEDISDIADWRAYLAKNPV